MHALQGKKISKAWQSLQYMPSSKAIILVNAVKVRFLDGMHELAAIMVNYIVVMSSSVQCQNQ